MVDRTTRDRLAADIEDFLAERIGAFELDERISNILQGDAADSVVNEVAMSVWALYDDLKDHKVALSKEQWDHLQRLLLLLRSDAFYETRNRLSWSWPQAAALATIPLFLWGGATLGMSWQLLACTIPLLVAAELFALGKVRDSTAGCEVNSAQCAPFSSLAEMRSIYRAVPHFRKKRHPHAVNSRRIRSAVLERIMLVSDLVVLCVFLPVILLLRLLLRALPQRSCSRRLVHS